MSEQSTSRPGLYVIVFFCLLNSCDAARHSRNAADALEKIADMTKPKPASY
jgi:hypothetical protein